MLTTGRIGGRRLSGYMGGIGNWIGRWGRIDLRIIRKGKMRTRVKMWFFECYECNFRFECEESEVDPGKNKFNQSGAIYKCPTCSNMVFSNRIYTE